MRALLLAALCSAAAAQPLELPARQAKLDEERSVLDYGLWNGRINALYDLGEMGRDGLPLLAYADDDADWQVRLTAVHFIGKVGLPAAPELAEVAKREPCLHVRLFALEWLATMGATGERYYREVVTPEDEAELARSPYRANPSFMGKPLAIDVPDEMNAEFFNGGADLRACASSEHAGRLRRHRAAESEADAEAAAHEVVTTAEVPAWARGGKGARRPGGTESFPSGAPGVARDAAAPAAPETPEQKRRNAELDKLLAPGKKKKAEVLPPGPPGAAPRDIASAAPRFEESGSRPLAAAALAPAVSTRAPETLPPGPPAPAPGPSEPGAAAFVADAGTGKPEKDPIPGLIEQLTSSDARSRSRAADELGKRGPAAAKAVPALRRALADKDRRVRASAVLALGSAGAADSRVPGDLRRAQGDKDEDVRFSARIALERLRRPAREP